MSSAETFTPRTSPSEAVAPPSGTTPTASNFIIPRTSHLASAALPGAGAFTAQGFFSIPPGTQRITFLVTYQRGAAGGKPLFQLEWTDGTTTSRDTVDDTSYVLSPDVVNGPNAQNQIYLHQPLGPVPSDGSAISYDIETTVKAGKTGVRLLMAEAGVVGSPGTASIFLTGQAP